MSAQLKLPLVSIVITSYNYGKYIADALDSVSLQTYRPLECIVVDDCSTDNSLEIIHKTIETLETKKNGIRYSVVSTEKNLGQLAAFQVGIKKAEGVFINFLDADDFLFPEFISVHVQAHLKRMVSFTFSEPVEIDSKNQMHSLHSDTGDAYSFLRIKKQNFRFKYFHELEAELMKNIDSDNAEISHRNILKRHKVIWNSWFWYPTTCSVFRKSALFHLCEIKKTDTWRICADCLLFCYANIIGNSLFIPFALSAYRRHGDNGFAGDTIVGSYRYLSKKSSDLNNYLYNVQLPLSLISLFAMMKTQQPVIALEFIKTLLYQLGPKFLFDHRKSIFEYYPEMNCFQKFILFLKTIIRHPKYKKKRELLRLK